MLTVCNLMCPWQKSPLRHWTDLEGLVVLIVEPRTFSNPSRPSSSLGRRSRRTPSDTAPVWIVRCRADFRDLEKGNVGIKYHYFGFVPLNPIILQPCRDFEFRENTDTLPYAPPYAWGGTSKRKLKLQLEWFAVESRTNSVEPHTFSSDRTICVTAI